MRDTSTLSLHAFDVMDKSQKKSQTKQKTGNIQKAIHNFGGPKKS